MTDKLPMLACRWKGKVYGAGKCIAALGGEKIMAVVTKCDEHRSLGLPKVAIAWLVQHGLPEDIAMDMVREAQRGEDADG